MSRLVLSTPPIIVTIVFAALFFAPAFVFGGAALAPELRESAILLVLSIALISLWMWSVHARCASDGPAPHAWAYLIPPIGAIVFAVDIVRDTDAIVARAAAQLQGDYTAPLLGPVAQLGILTAALGTLFLAWNTARDLTAYEARRHEAPAPTFATFIAIVYLFAGIWWLAPRLRRLEAAA